MGPVFLHELPDDVKLMRAVIQRVSQASVTVENHLTGKIEKGLLVYLGVGKDDTEADVQWIAEKIINLRIFADAGDKMNLSVKDVGGAVLLTSQFTLYGDCRKGRRPGFDASAPPEWAELLYEQTITAVRELGVPVQTGCFAAHMQVASDNDGPVTFLLDSKKRF